MQYETSSSYGAYGFNDDLNKESTDCSSPTQSYTLM